MISAGLVAWTALVSDLGAQRPDTLPPPPLVINVLDVGQGDAILIETPDAQWILVDAGRAEGGEVAALLRDRFGVHRLAVAVGSHRHADHIGGMPDVLSSISVGRYVGDTGRGERRAHGTTLLRWQIQQHHIPVQGPGADTIAVGGIRLIVLPQAPPDPNENNNSVVVRLEYGRFSMLLAGDAEDEERHWLTAFYRELLDVEVLKAAHHGSSNGESPDWLEATTPSLVVISAGVNAGYRHPDPAAVEDYEAAAGSVLCTNREGTIRLVAGADGHFAVTTERQTAHSCAYDGTAY
jgi:competence protein ComEC